MPSNSSERVETLETFSWSWALIFMQFSYFMVFSYVSEKNEIRQADNLNFRFCLLELDLDGIL